MNGDGIRFNIAALALAAGLFWGAAILIVSAANLLRPGYERLFLDLTGSIYPGYRPGFGDYRYVLRIGGPERLPAP